MKYLTRYVREIMYGGNDGIITTFAIVAGFTGAHINVADKAGISIMPVLLFGLANLFADGLSMSLGNFLSIRTERETTHDTRQGDKHPIISSAVTFCSFIAFGYIPLIPFFLDYYSTQMLFISSMLATLSALILLGIVRWKVTGKKALRSIAEVVIVGSIAATAAFLVGTLFATS